MFKGSIFGFLWLFTSFLLAQEKTVFTIVEADSQQPIEGVQFQYDNQTGTSASDGTIRIELKENQNLYLTDAYHNDVTVSYNDLKNNAIIQMGNDIAMPMVTVISVRPNTVKSAMQLSYTDGMQLDAGEVLNKVPEINGVRKSGVYGFDPVFRGFKYDQLNVLMDGVQSAAAACPNRMDPTPSHFSLQNVEKIELIKGPYSFRYGNSFGGTINYVTQDLFKEKSQLLGSLRSYYETNGNVWNNDASIGWADASYYVSVFGNLAKADDYEDGNDTEVPADMERFSIGTKMGFKLSDKQLLRTQFSRAKAMDVDYPSLPMDMRKDDTWMANVHHEIELDSKSLHHWTTDASISYVDHLMDNYDKIMNPRTVNAYTEAQTRAYAFRTEGMWKWKQSKLYTGFDLHYDQSDGTRYRTMLTGAMAGKTMVDNVWQNASILKPAVFAEYQYSTKKYDLYTSMRLEYNIADADNPDTNFETLYGKDVDNKQLNPNISIGLVRKLQRNMSIGLWLGRSQRSGSISERYINYFPVGLDPYEIVGNPSLDSEVNYQAELVYQYFTEKTQLNLNAYSSYLQDYIVGSVNTQLKPRMATAPGVRQMTNVDKAVKYGFELGWKQDWLKQLSSSITMAYTYGENKDFDEPLPEIAPFEMRFQLLANFIQNKLHPQLEVRQVFKQTRVADSFAEKATDNFCLVSLGAYYELNRYVKLTAVVHNLFDQSYNEH